jgi:hypothetical protein
VICSGLTAYTQPTPKPSSAMATTICQYEARANRKASKEAISSTQLAATTSSAEVRRASSPATLEAAKLASENGVSISPATTTEAPKP